MGKPPDDFLGEDLADHAAIIADVAGAEGNDGDRRRQLVEGHCRSHQGLRPRRADPVGADRLGNTFDVAVAQILDVGVQAGREAVAHMLGNHDFSRSCQAHEPGGEIYAATEDVVVLDDDVAHLEAGSQHDLAVCRPACVRPLAFMLNGKGRRHGGSHVGEVHQHAVAEAFNEPSIVRRKDIPPHVVNEIEPMGDDAYFVLFDKAHRPDDIHEQDRALCPGDGMVCPNIGQIEFCHWDPTTALAKPSRLPKKSIVDIVGEKAATCST